jgi:cytoskeletal protein CcmA (bactofilin family)
MTLPSIAGPLKTHRGSPIGNLQAVDRGTPRVDARKRGTRMGLQDFGKGRDDEPASPSRSSAGMGELNAFIDQGSEFSGRLRFSDTVRIDGKFDGEISSENTLIVGETGMIKATIQSNTVIISGEVEGDIIAPRQVVIHKEARVSGDIQTASLAVEEGAQINGQINMGGGAVSPREERSSKRREGRESDPKKANGEATPSPEEKEASAEAKSSQS